MTRFLVDSRAELSPRSADTLLECPGSQLLASGFLRGGVPKKGGFLVVANSGTE